MLKKILSYILFLLSLVFIVSCSNHQQDHNLSVYRALASSINNSNVFISAETSTLMNSLSLKLSSPETAEQALYLYPRAQTVKYHTNRILTFLDSLKLELKQEAGLSMIDGKEVWREDDVKAVNTLFLKKNRAEELKSRLEDYERNFLAIDSALTRAFNKSIINTMIKLSDSSENGQRSFYETFFANIPSIAALAILCKFQNNVIILENRAITFFCNQPAH